MKAEDFEGAKGWLADAPMFIDSDQVSRFHDAVIAPTSRRGVETFSWDEEILKKIAGEIETKVKAGIPFIDALKASIGLKSTRESGTTQSQGYSITMEAIHSSQRQLIELVEYYQGKNTDRMLYIKDPSSKDWRDPTAILKVPRMLVFLDFPGAAMVQGNERQLKLIPTAAEFENGKIILLFSQLHAKSGEKPPDYPEEAGNPEELLRKRNEYWAWFDRNISPRSAMQLVETVAAENGRIRWIDYRTPISKDGDTLHLHITPSGQYDTGVFAYNLIKRGFKHGLRIVGTMKSEPDMNVLAIYEK